MRRAFPTQHRPRAPSPGEPNRRALNAMANAASRARRYEGETSWEAGNEKTGPRRLVSRATASGRPLRAPRVAPVPARAAAPATAATHEPTVPGLAAGGGRTRRGLGRWASAGRRLPTLLVTAVGVLAVAFLALALALRSPAHVAPPASGAARTSPGSVERPGTSSRSAHRPSRSRGATSGAAPKAPPQPPNAATTSTTAATGATAGPRLTAVSPSSGAEGQRVEVRGSGMFSRNGEVVAYFGSTAAPTSCRSQTSCTVTVPDLGKRPATVYLTLLTESGRSNALAFSYA
jgi:hypothetical protein